MTRSIMAMAVSCVMCACASWEIVERGSNTIREKSYSVDLPAGWTRALFEREQIALTVDGFPLEQIVVKAELPAQAFKKLKKPVECTVLPSELSELQYAQMQTGDETSASMRVIENQPVTLGGKLGFKLHVQFRNLRGVPIERLIYGVCEDKTYYVLGYEAPSLHYFDHYKPAFEKMVASFRLTENAASAKNDPAKPTPGAH